MRRSDDDSGRSSSYGRHVTQPVAPSRATPNTPGERRRGFWYLGDPPPHDVAIAAIVLAIAVGVTHFAARHQHDVHRHLDAGAVVLLAIGAVALVARRRYPIAVLAVAFATTLAYVTIGYPNGPIWGALIIAFLTVLWAGDRVIAWVTIAVGYVLFLWLPPAAGTGKAPAAGAAIGLAAWLLVLGVIGELVRSRRDRNAIRAEAREQEASRRVSEERLRIARELHDVVAHNISLINVRAGVALHLLDQQPDEARAALAAIKDASGETLAELRSVLGVLREADETAPREPAPGLSKLPELIDRAAQAGVDVDLAIGGSPRPLPPAVDLAAYRIVQEAVTNVLRHAPDAHAEVRVTYRDHDVVVEVVDDGDGSAQVMADGKRFRSTGAAASARTVAKPDVSAEPDNRSGRGITGMRERVASLNGDFEAGRRAGGGFRVWARLPIEEARGLQ